MNQTEFDLEEFIIENNNPDNQYYLIKQNIKNLENDVFEFDGEFNKDDFKLFQKIDIFRGTVQYLEEFLLYFIAKFYNEKYSEVLSRTNNQDIFKKMSNILELSNLSNLLIDKLELNEFNVDEFILALNNIIRFFTIYKDAYNSIKHGFRVFPFEFDSFLLGNDELPYEKLNINDNYIQFLCKNGDNIYTLGYPIDCLVKDSEVVLEYIHECFNFLMRKNNYGDNLDFQCSSIKKLNKYVNLRNGEATIFFKYDMWFDKYLSGNSLIFYAKLAKKGNKITIHLSDVLEYPFLICIETKEILSTSPNLFDIENLKFIEFSEEGEIDQVSILYDILSSEGDFNYYVEFRKYKYECPRPNFSNIDDFDFECKIIKILCRLKQILQTKIYYPFKLSQNQYQLLTNHEGKFDKKVDAENFVNELKKDNRTIINVFLNVIDSQSKVVDKRFLGFTYDLSFLNYFNLEQLEDEKHFYFREFKDISGNVILILDIIKNHLNGGNDLSDLERYNFWDVLNFKFGYFKKFWVNEYSVFIEMYLK